MLNGWDLRKDRQLWDFISSEYDSKTVYPPKGEVFRAFKLTAFNDVKVVILGQDPYYREGQANGLCFSVRCGVKPPPSLMNIFKELNISPSHGDLSKWAEQGVLLLNTYLTVLDSKPNSHSCWESYTDKIIQQLNARQKPIIFVLWGANAKRKGVFITSPQHLVLTAAHPSPLSAYNGFFGCGHFDKINEFLTANHETPINWNLD